MSDNPKHIRTYSHLTSIVCKFVESDLIKVLLTEVKPAPLEGGLFTQPVREWAAHDLFGSGAALLTDKPSRKMGDGICHA